MIKNYHFLYLIVIIFFSCQNQSPNEKLSVNDGKSPYDYVNPFIGTGGEGHTYPGATVPFGMVQLSPDTDVKHFRESFPYCAGYQYEDSSIIGFSHTHFSGTGHSDMGDILIMPATGEIKLNSGSKKNPDEGYRSRFSHDQENASPGYYSVMLKDYNIKAELTTSKRVGFHKYTFPESDSSYIILDLVKSIYNYDEKVLWSSIRIENDSLITGYRQTKGWAANRYIYFAIQFSKPFKSYGITKNYNIEYGGFGRREKHLKNYPEAFGKKLIAYFNFVTETDEQIFLKVGISAVGTDGALKNLNKEIPHWDFSKTRAEAKQAWEKELNKIRVEAEQEEKEIFYTSVYHSMLAPVLYMDVDNRYRGIDNDIHIADNFTNHTIYSLWDTYRATHPLFTITNPARVNDMISSMLAHQEQSVHNILPVWSFHGNETWCMIGYHSVSVIADAFLKGINNYDIDKAISAMEASSKYPEYDGLKYYMEYGYMPIDKENESASKTLEYAYDDWTIAQMAKTMQKEEMFNNYIKRAGYYKNTFDKESKFMRAKKSDGSWREPFDPLYARYGGDFTEGNAWQYTWYVPHDMQGLIDLMGGKEEFITRLDSLFVIETDDEKYKEVEDIAGLIGQYAHGNEPSQHIAYLYNYAGSPWKTQGRIHQIMNNLFNNTPYGICGNEDCGQMSAWYIFSSMGFYPVCPGSGEYVIGSPCLKKASIHLDENTTFTMTANNLSDDNIYIQSATMNGQALENSFILHDDIINGGELVFEMGPEPNKTWAATTKNAPYSMTKK
ncbi:GH92 family glycosyl hydrolase [Bacteroidota bacterium]